MKQRINADRHRFKDLRKLKRISNILVSLSGLIGVNLLLLLLSSCSSRPTDLRTLVPAETLVYLETNDLAAALQPIVDSKPFTEVAKSKPDFSALKGVQLAVAVTGFETSEEELTDEHSVGLVQPHFVAVADTHAWNFQAVGFAEQKLGDFVQNIYNSKPKLDKSDKYGGKYFTWTGKDARKAYALVIDSLIYFGNDESSIEKCLAVRRGESDSIAKTGKIKPTDPATLASGYVSTDGIAQIAGLIGLKFGSETSEDSEVQSAIAGILPQLVRNTVTNITWTAITTEQGIEDKYAIGIPADVANVFSETMTSGDRVETNLLQWFPADTHIATIYNLKNPLIAWRSILLVTQKQTDPIAGRVIAELSTIIFEPYGIGDGEKFLGSSASQFVTANFSPDGDKPVVIAPIVDMTKAGLWIALSLKPANLLPPHSVLHSVDGETAAFFEDNLYIGGEAEIIESLHRSRSRGNSPGMSGTIKVKSDLNASIVTVGRDTTTTLQLIDLLAREGHGDTQAVSTYSTETRFTKSGMERRTVSDFGLIGSIVAQLGQD